MRFLGLAVVAFALVVVQGSAAAFRVDATTCSIEFRARNANLDCALMIPGGTLTLGGSLAITADVRGGVSAAFAYDSLGRPVAVDIGGNRTSYLYGDDGRLLAASDAGGTVGYTYDSLGRLLAAGDARFAYDDLGLRRAVEADSSAVDFTYDASGNLVTANAGTSTARFGYDAHSRLLRVDVDGSTTEYQYDRGQPILRSAEGQTTYYSYDRQRRLVRSATTGGDTVAYSYHSTGALLAVSDGAGVTRLTYDHGGRLSSIRDPGGGTTSFAYNGAGLPSLVVPDVGDEVVVSFLEGDPDQPLVIGAVYTNDRGETFTLNLRGRLSTCTNCP
jgi:YD repeat-containing protein